MDSLGAIVVCTYLRSRVLFTTKFRLFLYQGNIANYLSLAEVDSIYLPIPVNFIFIGFDGNGRHGKSSISNHKVCSQFVYTKH
jgi:hypothetical protein